MCLFDGPEKPFGLTFEPSRRPGAILGFRRMRLPVNFQRLYHIQ
ncbi:hypothetical protein SB6424_05443 [Klebsiella pasteurii]|nr:hypothetical protein SB6416_05428 [Klebsiella pasteurii]VUS87506.1 hypothetical protein SB6424_05443 [Klebsiella pasteurii]